MSFVNSVLLSGGQVLNLGWRMSTTGQGWRQFVVLQLQHNSGLSEVPYQVFGLNSVCGTMSNSKSQPFGNATTIKKFFSRQTIVSSDITASPETIWNLLTDGSGFTSWNSTILELTGKIAPGERIQLRSTLAPERKFKLKIKEFEANKRLAWGDALGTRIFLLSPKSASETRFSMTEKIGGPIFPLFARFIPSFDDSFNQFAADLKKAAEGRR